MLFKIYFNLRLFFKQLQKENMGAYAASISFFIILSIVPLLMIAFGILSYIHMTEQVLINTVNNYIPEFLDGPISRLIAQVKEQSQTVLPIALLVLIWSSGKAIWGMMMGLNAVNNVTENRNSVLVRLLASFYSILMLFLMLICLLLIALSNNVVDRISLLIPSLTLIFSFIEKLRFILIWFILTLYLTLAYTFLPNVKLRFWDQLPGAFLAAVCCSIFSFGFSIYVELFDSFNVYGSLSTLILIMIWMYTCMYMALVGANFNYFINNRFFKRR